MDETQKYYSLITSSFERLAPFYDLIALPINGLRDQVVRFTAAPTHSTILDVATGTGSQAIAFAKQGHEVTGVDLSDAMLAMARRKNQYSNLRFRTADATNLPFAANTFDIASISFALHDMPLMIQRRVLNEMVRVTRPEGNIVVVDYGLPRNRLSRSLIYLLVSLYEGEYYKVFIRSGLTEILESSGIHIVEERTALFRSVRMIRGTVR